MAGPSSVDWSADPSPGKCAAAVNTPASLYARNTESANADTSGRIVRIGGGAERRPSLHPDIQNRPEHPVHPELGRARGGVSAAAVPASAAERSAAGSRPAADRGTSSARPPPGGHHERPHVALVGRDHPRASPASCPRSVGRRVVPRADNDRPVAAVLQATEDGGVEVRAGEPDCEHLGDLFGGREPAVSRGAAGRRRRAGRSAPGRGQRRGRGTTARRARALPASPPADRSRPRPRARRSPRLLAPPRRAPRSAGARRGARREAIAAAPGSAGCAPRPIRRAGLTFAVMPSPEADTVVMKFGGTSVADAERIKNAARRIVQRAEEGTRVVAVLSARGKQPTSWSRSLTRCPRAPTRARWTCCCPPASGCPARSRPW